MAAIALNQISKAFGSVAVTRNLNRDIESEEFVAFPGRKVRARPCCCVRSLFWKASTPGH